MKLAGFIAALVAAPVLVGMGPMASAHAAVGITKAELQGTQLRVEGSGALSNHIVTVSPGAISATTDSNGAYKIQVTPYSSPTCQITVSDGATSLSTNLAGCTPATTPAPVPPPPTPTPAPTPSPPPPVTPPPTATGPQVSFSPTSLTFGPQTVGTTSATQTITITNPGTSALFFNRVSTNGTGVLDYTVVVDNCVGSSVPAGGNCTQTVDFHPSADGAVNATVFYVDNAPASPQAVALTGTGVSSGPGPTPLRFDTTGMPCTAGVCDYNGGFPVIHGNFFAGLLVGRGGTAPYAYSATGLPAGLTVTPGGLISGTLPTQTGVAVFSVTIADSAGAVTAQQFSITVGNPPAPGTPGCQKAPGGKEPLSGAAIAGTTPTGQAIADESQLTACGGFTILTVSVSNVKLGNGTVLWVYYGGGAVGTITLNGGSGSIKPYNLGGQFPTFVSVSVIAGPPPIVSTQRLVLTGWFFS
ncbi:MAG: trimeric autotransporter adhesin [Acidimicrobiaceae bacterium]|nr:trimeric autotransporter adhesin [Acidimicrobiaceae bacterium]